MKIKLLLILIILLATAVNAVTTTHEGVFYWGNTTDNEVYHRKWNSTDLNTSVILQSAVIGNQEIRWADSDYSKVKDIAAMCTTDSGSDADLVLINTSNGEMISTQLLEASVGSNNRPRCSVMYWNGTDEAIVVYEDDATANAQYGIRYIDGKTVNAERLIKVTQHTDGELQHFKLKESPARQEAAIGYSNEDSQIVGFTIYTKGGEVTFNYSTPNTITPSTDNGEGYALDWTADGNYLILITKNSTGSTTGDEFLAIYNRTSNEVTEYVNSYADGSTGEMHYGCAETLYNRSDAIIYIGRMYSGAAPVVANVIYRNGSKADNSPTQDSAAYRYTAARTSNIGCYTEQSGNKTHLFYVDLSVESYGINSIDYDSFLNKWNVSSLVKANYSENLTNNSIADLTITPCVNNTCAMLSFRDINEHIVTGIVHNSTHFDNTSTAIVDTIDSTIRRQYAFMFYGNLSAEADVLAPSLLDFVALADDESIAASWTSLEEHNYTIHIYNSSEMSDENLTGSIINKTTKTNHSPTIRGLKNATPYYGKINVSDADHNIQIKYFNFTTDQNSFDLMVNWFRYTLPVNWSNDTNTLIRGTNMTINISIYNNGNYNASNVDYNFSLNGAEVCQGTIANVPEKNDMSVLCNWTTTTGFHIGNLSVDYNNNINETNITNNNIKVYIPFMDRPWYHFNQSYWKGTLEPYALNSTNEVANDGRNWAYSYNCAAFSNGYTANQVDPYGKKGRECAYGCFVRNWTQDPAKPNCDKAYEHLLGWSNRTAGQYTSAQAVHELFHVGMTYDLMFANLTQEQNEMIAGNLSQICLHVTNLTNVWPDRDDDDKIIGDNGKGFGSGVGGFCYSILGADLNNPTLMHTINDTYRYKNTADEWMHREESYLRSYKNDSWSTYQEGWAYKMYSQYHLVENWWFQLKFGLNNLDQYDNALCAMGREAITSILDYTYNGDTLRNDKDQNARTIQKGDGRSYDVVGHSTFPDFDILLYYGLLCSDTKVKSSLLWLRNYSWTQGDGKDTHMAMFLFKELEDEAAINTPETNNITKVQFDNANDIFTIRTNFTYMNDTVIMIDGGEERGGGHSQAQGYFMYVFGEPLLDYEQVPFNDDVRMDTWKNGISLQNTTQVREGANGIFNNATGQKGYHQYYGSNDGLAYYSTDYPDFRIFPLANGGDLEDYIGTEDASFAGVYAWRPMFNGANIREYFIKYDDLLAKRTRVTGNNESDVYHNYINIFNESDETRTGVNISFNRTSANGQNVFLDINVMYMNETFTLGGGDTNVTVCYDKTNCGKQSSSRYTGNATYRRTYLRAEKNDTDLILAHHWYTLGNQKNQSEVGTTDRGLNQSGNHIIYDTDNDNEVNNTLVNASGWGIAYNFEKNETGAFNTTSITTKGFELFSSNDTVSVFLERNPNTITLTTNTMERKTNIDYARPVQMTVDIQELENTSSAQVNHSNGSTIASTLSGTSVTFTVLTGQNSDYYTITGGTTTATTTPETSTPGGGGGSIQQPVEDDIVNDTIEEICARDTSLFKRIFSNCKIPENEICDDGEVIFVDKDCTPDWNNFEFSLILESMWLIRALIVLSAILFLTKNRKMAYVVVVLLVILFLNNAEQVAEGLKQGLKKIFQK